MEEKGGNNQEEDVDVNHDQKEKVKKEGVVWMKKGGGRRKGMKNCRG